MFIHTYIIENPEHCPDNNATEQPNKTGQTIPKHRGSELTNVKLESACKDQLLILSIKNKNNNISDQVLQKQKRD